MNCCNNQDAITIVRANDTDFNGQHLLTLRISSEVLDLSDLSAIFTLVDVQKTFEDLSSGEIVIDYSASETAEFPLGIIYGDLNIISKTGKISTIENRLAFNVISVVHGNAIAVKPYEYNIKVEQGGENILNVLVEAGVSVEVGTTTTLPSGSDATVENVGTPNHLVLNFGIPQGEKGEKGEDGEQGEKGEDGAEGPQGPAGKDGVDGKDAKINGVNTLTLNATNGIQLNQSGDTASIDGKPLQDGISDINSKIPSSASSSNKLADTDYVNSSINNMAAFYITSDVSGDPFATRADLIAGPYYFRGQLREPTQNDYALVTEDETHDDMTSRYMYDGTQWVWQYTLNNTQFTQAQIDAINSGITESLVNKIGQNESSITNLQNTKQDTINDLATIRSGADAGATAVQPAALNNYVPTSRTVNGQPLSSDVTIDTLPSQTGQSGKYLTTDGTDASWGTLNALKNTASGQGSLTILGTPATGENAVNIGNSTSVTKWATISIGYNNSSTGDYAISIGESVTASGNQSIAIGRSARAQYDCSIAIGFSARISNLEAIAIGHNSWARGYCSTAVGTMAETGVSRTQATAIGFKAKADANDAIQIGYGTNTEASTFYVGFNNTNYKLLDSNGLIPAARHAELPTADGTYTLKLTISDGTPTLSWVAD